MSLIVVVSVRQGTMVEQMATMRDWLDSEKYQPNAFRYMPDADGGEFRVEFQSEDEALKFAQVFGGRMMSSLVRS